MSARLHGRVALVTGGGAGIGRAISLAFAAEGARVAVLDRDEATAHAVAREVEGLALTADVADAGQVGDAVGTALARLGRIDVLVNNAGVSPAAPFLELSEADWQATFRVNVDGVATMCRAVLPAMIEQGTGVVINLASWLGKAGRPLFSAYAASKFAVIGLTQSLAWEMAPHGIRVNALCPGIIAGTPMRAQIEAVQARLGLPGTEERVRAAVPLGRPGRPEDVARTAVFLASDDAAYLTGEAVNVGGGLWMH
jgi:NAD(P)-dependent dehydrogenase (short-subunit alcohol dehydrogenase family)